MGTLANFMTVCAVVDYPFWHGLNPASPGRLDYSVKVEGRGFFGEKLNPAERRSVGRYYLPYKGLKTPVRAAQKPPGG
jgi:hypothetical protein